MRTYLGRILTAIKLLLVPGDHTPVTRQDLLELRREWVTWEITFTDTLEKLNAWAARQAKREKRAIEAGLMATQPPAAEDVASDPKARKRELYRRAAGMGIGVMPETPEIRHVEPPPAEDEP